MSIYSLYLTIESEDAASIAFKILKQHDPALELGDLLTKLRLRQKIIEYAYVEKEILEEFFAILDKLEQSEIRYTVWVCPVPPIQNQDGSKTHQASRAEVHLELRQMVESERRTEAFQAFCRARSYKDPHWILIDREEEFKTVLKKVQSRARRLEFTELSREETNFLYIEDFERAMFSGGFGCYFADPFADSVKELMAALHESRSVEVLALVKESLHLFAPWGGYAESLERRIEQLSQVPMDHFEGLDSRFVLRSEDPVSLALLRLQEVYEGYS